MKGDNQETGQESQLSTLAAALLRLSGSLDLETVLREVVEGACSLTGARCGVIATIDEEGLPQDFVTSGFTEEEHRTLVEWPDGPKLFAFLRDLPGPLRIRDAQAYARSLGFSADDLPSQPFQGTPMRHREVHVGNFYLLVKEGGEHFTEADEEVLMLFAAQAAAAIAHARAYRNERRTRANLEALIETSPVGVVVFDVANGGVVSINREARRIVERLRSPGQKAEDLLENIVCRRGDGREVSLAELPLPVALSRAERVRGEEIELLVPDGRSVSTLINVTPISGEDASLVSVVVTMQDLTPLEELERMRADFLGIISHELRVPLTSIKGSAATVLRRSRTFDPSEIEQFFRIIEEQTDLMDSLISDLLDAGRIETGTLSVAPRPSELADLVDRARITFLSSGGRHRLNIDLPPDLPRVMADRDRIVQVLNNLLANAARHSADSLPIHIHAVPQNVHVTIAVSDEGHGIAPDQLAQLFSKYTRTEGERWMSGGLGLAICKGIVEAHGGRIRAESGGPSQGARFIFTLPTADKTGEETDSSPQRPTVAHQATGKRLRILVVDDDPETLRLTRGALEGAGYAPVLTGNHQKLGHFLDTEKPALVLLDLMLPGTDGIKLLERVPGLSDLPVIFISGYGRDETVARALEAGAEDYIVKPFSPTELVARVRAALRRRVALQPFTLGDLAIDYQRRQVTVAGNPVRLTATEYELLLVLSLNAGQVTTYKTLLRQVWDRYHTTNPQIVRAYITRLRRKLGENAQKPTYIHTHNRVGYSIPQPTKT